MPRDSARTPPATLPARYVPLNEASRRVTAALHSVTGGPPNCQRHCAKVGRMAVVTSPRVRLDTDIGGDIDDLCALAMLLGWTGVELVGATTVADEIGRRAGCAPHALSAGCRMDIPVAAGMDVSTGYFRLSPTYPSEEAYWGEA